MISVILQDGSTFTGEDHEQLFHFTPDGGQEIIICVSKLVELRQQHPDQWYTIEAPCDAEGATTIFARGGITYARLSQLSPARLREPGYAVFTDDGSFLIVDGNHRYYARYRAGLDFMRFHVAWAPHWHAALVDVEASARLIRG
jgi:hypothetical protein